VVWRISAAKREEVVGGWREDCIMRSFMTCTHHRTLL